MKTNKKERRENFSLFFVLKCVNKIYIILMTYYNQNFDKIRILVSLIDSRISLNFGGKII